MNKRQKSTILSAMLLCSFLSTVYLNVEMAGFDTLAAGQDMHSLPDVKLLQNVLRLIIEPLTMK